jgi:hypothetical protein
MTIDPSVLQVFEKAAENSYLTKQECRQLLSYPEQSLESGVLMLCEAGFTGLLYGDTNASA